MGGDVGGNLLRRLELSETPWVQVLRSNRTDVDPLYFGIYGDVIYHHGAAFRGGALSPAHRDHAPVPRPLPSAPIARQAVRLANSYRWRRWEQETVARHREAPQRIIDGIQRGDGRWLNEFR